MATEASSTTNQTEIFQQLESYPWDKDTEFQGGLSAILGPNPTAQTETQITDLTLRAQCFYLSRKKNISIDFDAYKSYLTTKSPSQQQQEQPSSSPPPSQQVPSPLASNSATQTQTQPQTPTPSTPPQTNPQSQPSTHHSPDLSLSLPITPEKQAPYPPTFTEIVALITSGAPIPGIKEIPDTLLTGQETKPVVGKRRKPWEKDVPIPISVEEEESVGGTFGDERDRIIVQDLPVE